MTSHYVTGLPSDYAMSSQRCCSSVTALVSARDDGSPLVIRPVSLAPPGHSASSQLARLGLLAPAAVAMGRTDRQRFRAAAPILISSPPPPPAAAAAGCRGGQGRTGGRSGPAVGDLCSVFAGKRLCDSSRMMGTDQS